MYPKSQQWRQYTWVGTVAPIVKDLHDCIDCTMYRPNTDGFYDLSINLVLIVFYV